MLTENTTSNGTKNHFTSFPVGYYQLHPDVSINYQLNRYYIGDQSMLTEMRTVAPGFKGVSSPISNELKERKKP